MADGAPLTRLAAGNAHDDVRIGRVLDEHSHYELSPCTDREEWLRRAHDLRQRILCCCGLWPMPERQPLNARVFGRVEHDGYATEKVYFESRPGFFVTGNLYRPLQERPSRPAVLCPHGHWTHGRLEDSDACSVPARCATFARQGYVAFSYDMVGYLDSCQVEHAFGARRAPDGAMFLGSHPDDALWGINAVGVQLWNSIRSLDFLQNLPEVDGDRIGCTGASGGGTQTFLLTAVDDRVAAAAPVCMVSPNMQGGCICENAPNLRIDTSNIEIAALAAPRPLLLVSATDDFTREGPTFAYPAIREVYDLFGATDKVDSVHVAAGHNYNGESRAAVYAWFAKWLLGTDDTQSLREQPRRRTAGWTRDSLVFYGTERPERDMDDRTLREDLLSEAAQAIEDLSPHDAEGVRSWCDALGPLYEHSLLASLPQPGDLSVARIEEARIDGIALSAVQLSRHRIGDQVAAVEAAPAGTAPTGASLLVHGDGTKALVDIERHSCAPLVRQLVERGRRVLVVDCFAAKGSSERAELVRREQERRFFQTYNRTVAMERIQDILTAIAYLRHAAGADAVDLLGFKAAGIWCLLARAVAGATASTVVDVDGFASEDDRAWVEHAFIPLIRRAGGLETALALAAPAKLCICNARDRFPAGRVSRLYQALGKSEHLRIEQGSLADEEIIRWIAASG